MKALRWKRRQSQCVAPVQGSSLAAHMITTSAAAPTVTTSAQRAAAGRQAIADCPEAFEDLRGEGDRERVEQAATNDEDVLKALATVGELTADQAPYLGKFLAEQLFADAADAEYQKQLDSYRSARRTAFTDEDADLAYEPTDPKHPGFPNRVGA
ncbi:UNVERIFIED_ORG: hypothetical protein ABIB52_000776 [Arthrobacter sp. UYCu721]